MKRRLFTFLSAASCLLAMALAGLWIRSYWWNDQIDKFRHVDEPDSETTGKVGVFEAESWRGRARLFVEMNTGYMDDDGQWHIESSPASLPGLAEGHDLDVEPANPPIFFDAGKLAYHIFFNRAGFALYRNDINSTGHDYTLISPLWPMVLLTMLPPALWIRSRRKSRRLMRIGLCPNCSYDLRATPGRCPECGTVPTVGAR